MIRLALAVATVLVVVTAPASAAAQRVSLATVDSLTRMGRTEEARSILTRWIAAVEGNAPRLDLQHALWLRAILTVDPAQAAVDFQRLVVEFPGGGWTDQALLRLGQHAVARGDVAAAAAHFRALARDHPGSPARLTARSWLEENADAVAVAEAAARERARAQAAARPAEPPSPAGAASASAGSTGKSAGYVAPPAQAPDPQPRRVDPALPPDTLGRERLARPPGEVAASPSQPAAPPGPSAEEAADGDFTVQLGAFASVARARALMERVSAAGFEPRLVDIPGSDLVRVRVGRFDSPETATRLYDRIVAQGFEAAVVADAAREVARGG